jgi:mRNA interferase RelE/StbE
MLGINFSRQAEKFLRKAPPKHARQIGGKVMALRGNPQPHDSLPLKGAAAHYRRADIGEYRIVYRVSGSAAPGAASSASGRVSGDVLEIVLIGKRNDDEVYKMVRRLA